MRRLPLLAGGVHQWHESHREQVAACEAAIRATLDRALVRADTAEVRVRLTESYGNDSPFSSGQSSNNQTFTLKQTDGAWRLTDSPWPLYCPAPTPPR